MTHRPIIDAGPGLNFLSINKERLLISVLGPLSTPETVQAEVLRKAQQDERFRAAAVVWQKLIPKWVQILSDDAAVGSIRLASSLTVLERAAGGKQIPDKATMRNTYERLRGLDDGLPPVEKTNLLTPALWLPDSARRPGG